MSYAWYFHVSGKSSIPNAYLARSETRNLIGGSGERLSEILLERRAAPQRVAVIVAELAVDSGCAGTVLSNVDCVDTVAALLLADNVRRHRSSRT